MCRSPAAARRTRTPEIKFPRLLHSPLTSSKPLLQLKKEEAGKDKLDMEMIEFSLGGLKKAAENIARMLPTVLPISMQIVETVRNMIT
jgi:hypothetical protein